MKTMNHHLVRTGFQVPDLEASVRHAVETLGLEIRNQTETQVDLALPGQEACFILRAHDTANFDFMALHTSQENFDEILRRLEDNNVVNSEGVELPSPAVRFLAPNGVAVEIGVGTRPERNEQPRVGGPVIGSLDHLSFSAEDPDAFADFFVTILGFRVSDSYLNERHWLRCNANHHTVAVFRGQDGIHHYAFETSDIRGLADLGDVLAQRDQNFMWGPGRHGLGLNIFTYHLDPAGSILEVCSNMVQIDIEENWDAQVWTDGLKSAILWGPLPPAGFREISVPPLRTAGLAQ